MSQHARQLSLSDKPIVSVAGGNQPQREHMSPRVMHRARQFTGQPYSPLSKKLGLCFLLRSMQAWDQVAAVVEAL